MRATIAGVLLVGLCLVRSGGVARAADAETEGRKHARKANHLADLNKCKAAIPEYDKALRLIKDPSLLFNRAECYRRTDQPEKATADYREFLVELPAAPNRAQVEAQIAALQTSSSPASSSAAAAAAPVAAPASAHPAARPAAASAPATSASVAEKEAAPPPLAEPPPLAPMQDGAQPLGLLDAQPTPAQPAEAEQKSGHMWIWVALGVVVVGAAAGTYVLLNQSKTDTSGGALGNYKF